MDFPMPPLPGTHLYSRLNDDLSWFSLQPHSSDSMSWLTLFPLHGIPFLPSFHVWILLSSRPRLKFSHLKILPQHKTISSFLQLLAFPNFPYDTLVQSILNHKHAEDKMPIWIPLVTYIKNSRDAVHMGWVHETKQRGKVFEWRALHTQATFHLRAVPWRSGLMFMVCPSHYLTAADPTPSHSSRCHLHSTQFCPWLLRPGQRQKQLSSFYIHRGLGPFSSHTPKWAPNGQLDATGLVYTSLWW
jgi:hypothetical protein